MSQQSYITERLFPEFIKQACKKLQINFTSLSSNWVLRLEKNGKHRWVVGYSLPLNSVSASNLAFDKVATSLALESSDIPNIEHYLARSRGLDGILVDNLSSVDESQPVVIKPLEGVSGRGVKLFPHKPDAVNYLARQPHADWAMSPWYEIISEKRFICLDGKIILSFEKTQPHIENGLAFYNLGKGAIAKIISPSENETDLVLSAFRCSSLRLAAIDLVTLRDGDMRVLEINEGIMLENFSRQSKGYKDVAQKVYDQIVEKIFE